MCDMRYEDEGCMLPHSRAHHENLQFVNDLLKEEDDTWQDVGSSNHGSSYLLKV